MNTPEFYTTKILLITERKELNLQASTQNTGKITERRKLKNRLKRKTKKN